MTTKRRSARVRFAATVLAASGVAMALGACSTGSDNSGGSADDAVLGSIADRIAAAVSDRLGMMEQVAWVSYVAKSGVDDQRGDRIQTQAFLKATVPAGVPKGVALRTIQAQLSAGKSVQRILIQQWATGVTPPPDGLPPNLARDVAPKIAEYTANIAAGMRQLQVQGVTKNWSSIMSGAADDASNNLAASVTKSAYGQAIAPIAAWPPPTSSSKK